MAVNSSLSGTFEVAEVFNEAGAVPVLIVCEHASNHIPAQFENLGLAPDTLETHIAWDPGAREVAHHICKLMNAPGVFGCVSRLVYDCNRPPEADDAIPEVSEVYDIPGNTGLTLGQKQHRVATVYEPFRHCVAEAVKPCRALVTIHSFTPVYAGEVREVELGILYDMDTSLVDILIAKASSHTDLLVQRNEPYGPQHGVTHTIKVHGVANDIPNVMIEIRSDLIRTEQACKDMATMLSGWISEALDEVLSPQQTAEKRA